MIKPENEQQHFDGLNATGLSFDGHTFIGCSFENCSFNESSWLSARFYECIFKNSNISLVNLEGTRLQDVYFEDCKVVGANFFKCDKQFFSINFRKSILIHCNFSDLKMHGACFQKSKLKECYFTNTDLKKANFSHTDCAGTLFHNCNLENADFSHAVHYGIDPQLNKLKKARFTYPEAASLLNYLEIIVS